MENILSLSQRFKTRTQCLKFLEQLRWPDGVTCLKCNSKKISRLRTVEKFQCLDCRAWFSVTAGTVMHRSHLPLGKWILAAFLICNAKKGISAKQVQRDLHVTYKTAWYLLHRLRRAMREESLIKKMTGVVEADETYIGGRRRGRPGRGAVGKMIVLGAIERRGMVRAEPAENVKMRTIARFVRAHVSPDAKMLVADRFASYDQLGLDFNLKRINHQIEYVRGEIHTQNIESFWAVLKRGIMGTYHKMSSQYLPLYLAEFTFRRNHNGKNGLYRRVLRNGLTYDPVPPKK